MAHCFSGLGPPIVQFENDAVIELAHEISFVRVETQ
jgi:hypothetical protein